jgi:hypothetical protein
MEFVINSEVNKRAAIRAVEALAVPPPLKEGEKPTWKVQTVTIAEYSRKRSVQQNRAYWKVILPPFEAATKYPAVAWHEYFKSQFVEPDLYEINGKLIESYKSTTEMSTVEFMKYVAHIRVWAAENMPDLVIPEIESRKCGN